MHSLNQLQIFQLKDSHPLLQSRIMNSDFEMSLLDTLRKTFSSFLADPHHNCRKATFVGKLYSLTVYSFSLQNITDSFIQVLQHISFLICPLMMVAKACFKMASKSTWIFLGKWWSLFFFHKILLEEEETWNCVQISLYYDQQSFFFPAKDEGQLR